MEDGVMSSDWNTCNVLIKRYFTTINDYPDEDLT